MTATLGIAFGVVSEIMIYIPFDELLPTARVYGNAHTTISRDNSWYVCYGSESSCVKLLKRATQSDLGIGQLVFLKKYI